MAMPRLAVRCHPQPPHRASLPRDTTGGSRGLRGGSAAAGGLTVKSERVPGAGQVGRAPECCRFGREASLDLHLQTEMGEEFTTPKFRPK